jgi:monomeric sarcosine oxidase
VLEQRSVCNEQSAGHDVSKAFRIGYSEDLIYTEMALQSIPLWKELEAQSGEELYLQTGCLLLNARNNSFAIQSLNAVHAAYDSSHLQLLRPTTLRERFPQFSEDHGVFDPLGGVLNAELTVRSMHKIAAKAGVEFREHTAVQSIEQDHVIVANGTKLFFGKLIVAAGAWASKLIDVPVTPTLQHLMYLEPNNPADFSADKFPVFSEFDWGWYGFPLIDGTVKIAKHKIGTEHDPEDSASFDSAYVKEGREFLKACIPTLADAKLVKTGVCHYAMTPNEDFIIDHISGNIIVAAGFSGHGFKFCPLIGAVLSDLALEFKPRFDLKRFTLLR